LEGIRKSLNDEKDNKIAEFFYRERLSKRLVITLEDQIEKNREIAVEIIQKMTVRVGLKDES
jgi:predicted secreted protein